MAGSRSLASVSVVVTSPIRVSAVVIRDPQGCVLTVRKKGTSQFMLPGGKPEPGEQPLATAVREVAEEIEVALRAEDLRFVGTFTADAANEPGRQVVATIYEHPMVAVTRAGGEIEELCWLDPEAGDWVNVAPLLTDAVLPALRGGRFLRAVTVFTGATPGVDPGYSRRAAELAVALAEADIDVVYGGGNVGLMGAVADAALTAGGNVIGVMPQHLVDREVAHRDLTRLEVVGSMHERKLRMADLGDAFVALPGGAGTLEELFEAWTWLALGIHTKPVALYDAEFWAPLVLMLDHMVSQGFIRPEDRNGLVIASDPNSLILGLKSWTPPPPKWRS
ncbi:MAG: TIGR00730 family Rossman fold protein [Oryzihumus sp.]